jgi:hypothetical protein
MILEPGTLSVLTMLICFGLEISTEKSVPVSLADVGQLVAVVEDATMNGCAMGTAAEIG